MNSFIDLWQKENLPLEKKLLMTASGWLKGHDVEKVLDTVKLILKLNLPMTEEVFHGLYSLNNGKSFSNLLDQFFHYLNQNQLKQDAIMNKIQVFFGKDGDSVNWGNAKEVYRVIINLKNLFGFYLSTNNTLPLKNISPILELLKMFHRDNSPRKLKLSVEQLAHRITGLQLLNRSQENLISYQLTLPLPFPEQTFDCSFQFHGQKDKDGKLNKNYFQILFDLYLPNLEQILIVMNVQNRIISLTVKNDLVNIKTTALPFVKSLKENLAKLNYQLTTINFERLTKADHPVNNKNHLLDFRQAVWM